MPGSEILSLFVCAYAILNKELQQIYLTGQKRGSDFGALYRTIKQKCQAIVGITVNNAEIKEVISNLAPDDYKYIHIGEKAFV